MEDNNENAESGEEVVIPEQDSILLSIKNMIGINSEDKDFDLTLVNNINSALFTLTQIGVGPQEGFSISGPDEVWNDFIGETNLGNIKLYIYLKLRLSFDPPTNAFVVEAIKEQIKETEYRLHIQMDKEGAYE